MKRLLHILLLLLLSISTFAQRFPISVTTILTPPYTTSLSTMAESGSTRLMVNLLVNDVTITEIPVKLHIKMECAGITIESIPTQVVRPMFLGGGEARVLTGDDFAEYLRLDNLNFKGFSKEAYVKNGQLPGGLWKFSVTVRHFYSNSVISNVGTATAWITSYKPPVLSTPKNNEIAPSNAGLPLTFSWQASKHTGGTAAIMYRFEMWERRVEGVPAQAVAATIPPIYSTETAGLTATVLPASLALEPGMKYCWRVTAYDPSGMVTIENKGESEVRTFQYLEKCPEVCGLTVDIKDDTGYASWEENRQHLGGYNFEFYDDEGTCHKTLWGSSTKTAGIGGEYGKTWHVRVQGICLSDVHSEWSELVDFKIPDAFKPLKDENGNTFECGKEVPERVITNFTLRDNLQKGDTIENRRGTTKFVIHSATRNEDGSFRGLSYMLMRIWGVSFLGEFDHLNVNTDGVIVGKYSWRTVDMGVGVVSPEDIEKWADETALAIAGATYNNTIKDTVTLCCGIKFESIRREGNKYYALRNDTLPVEITSAINGKNRTLIKDDKGHELVIDKDGNVMGVEEYKKCGGSKALLRENIKEKDSQVTKSGNVKFFSAGKYLFDTYDDYTNAAKGYAERFPSIGEGDYRPAYACAESNTKIEIKAEPYANITFKNERGVPVLCKDGILEVTARGDRDTTSIYAYDADNHIVGKVNVLSYDKVTRKICLVPIGDTKAPDASAVKQGLDEIFAMLMVDFDVTIGEPIAIQYAKDNIFTHGGSGMIGVYNTDQKAAISKLKERGIDNETVYLFFVKDCKALKANDSPDVVNGYMPRGYQLGFIYKELSNFRTIAHEICHGAFHLKHTFDATDYLAPERTTDNLMDYNDGKTLNHWQWKDIHQPKSVRFKWLQDEEGAEAWRQKGTKILCINDESAINAIKKYRYFYLPDGRIVDLEKYTPSGFYAEDDVTPEARGALAAIRICGLDNTIRFETDKQTGKHTVLAFVYLLNDKTRIESLNVNQILCADTKNLHPVRVYISADAIVVTNESGQPIERIALSGNCGCNTTSKLDHYFFANNDKVDQEYVKYAKSKSTRLVNKLSDDLELLDYFTEKAKTYDISEYKLLFGEVFVDKILAYEKANEGRKFIIVAGESNVISEDQGKWLEFANDVFSKAGLGSKDILITLPYVDCNGIGPDKGRFYFMPGVAVGNVISILYSALGNDYNNICNAAGAIANGDIDEVRQFVLDLFKQTKKKHIQRYYYLTKRGDLVCRDDKIEEQYGYYGNYDFRLSY
ncbi:MAG: hypothetical protein J6Y72_11980, partial [Bacteroidales bacterium]|nr:hypothetical protein [Bacteroidales bacterium]